MLNSGMSGINQAQEVTSDTAPRLSVRFFPFRGVTPSRSSDDVFPSPRTHWRLLLRCASTPPHPRAARPRLEELEVRSVPSVAMSPVYEGIGYDFAYSPGVELGLIPDSSVAVGPRYFIEMANDAIVAVDKSTGAFPAGAPMSVRNFFAPSVLPGQAQPIGFFDPIAAY